MVLSLPYHLLFYCLLLSVLLFGSLAINPRSWLHRMPPAVRRKVAPRSNREKRQLLFTGTPFLISLIAYPVLYTVQLDADFLKTLVIITGFFLAFDLWDTLVLDLWVFCRLTPRFLRVPGTEKADYSDRRYHIRSGLKGLVFLSIAALSLSAFISLISVRGA